MTARKNQAQPIILKAVLFIGPFRRTPLRFEISHELVLRRIKSCPSTQSINGFESGRRNQPWSRVVRNTSLRPGLQSGGECLMHGLFGEIQISEEAHERRQNPARVRSVKSLNGPAELFGHRRRHPRQTSKRSGSTQLRSSFPYPQFSGPPLR